MSDSTILDKCCMIGESVAGNPMHFMVERSFASADLDWRFLTFEIDGRRLNEALTGLDALGINGALLVGPLREAAASCYPHLSERSRRTGSVTCLVREEDALVGDNFIGEAAADSIEQRTPLAGKQALLLGAARVAHSLADGLSGRGIKKLWVSDRNHDVADALVDTLAGQHAEIEFEAIPWDDGHLDLPDKVTVVVSSASWPKSRDVSVAEAVAVQAHSGLIVFDARLSPSRTALLRSAAGQGATVVDSLEVLSRETAMAIHAWTGTRVDRDALREAAEEFLGV